MEGFIGVTAYRASSPRGGVDEGTEPTTFLLNKDLIGAIAVDGEVLLKGGAVIQLSGVDYTRISLHKGKTRVSVLKW